MPPIRRVSIVFFLTIFFGYLLLLVVFVKTSHVEFWLFNLFTIKFPGMNLVECVVGVVCVFLLLLWLFYSQYAFRMSIMSIVSL